MALGHKVCMHCFLVSIEPLWNGNHNWSKSSEPLDREVSIEPLWNGNIAETIPSAFKASGLNRTIVEWKSHMVFAPTSGSGEGLNRTIVEWK